MADNTTLNEGSGGNVFASDDVGGVHYQRIKLTIGGDGVTEGDVSTINPLPVVLSSAGTITISDGSSDAEVVPLAGYNALAVSIMDGSGSQITSFGGGTQYTEGDTDSSITGTAMLMEGAANALVPVQGTAADGLLVNLGSNNDVTVTGSVTVSDGGGSITVDGTVAVSGSVTVADGGSTISIDDGGGTITVDGTVAATQSGAWNITNVSGTVSLPTGASTAANQSTIITSVQLIDDAIVADNAGFTDGTTKLDMAGFIYDEVAGTALTENDAAAARINVNRAQVQAIEDGATRGRYATVSAANALKVDGSAVTQPVSIAAAVPVTDNSGSLTVDNGGTFAVQVTSIAAGNNNIGDVDIASVPAPLSTTGGGTEAAALRVTIATDSTGVLSVDDNGSTLSIDDGGGSITVDGTVTANLAAGTNNIGDVDVLTINGVAPAFGTGTRSAATQRVTIATDDVVPASQSGAWTVTANAGTNLNTSALALESGGNLASTAASLAVLDDWDEVDRAKVNIIAGQAGITAGAGAVGASTPRVTLASDDPVTVAVQLIDDIVYTDDTSTHATGTSKGALIMAAATPTDGSVNANDIGAVAMTVDRKLHVSVQDAIPAGTNNIGDVDVASIAAGDNAIGRVKLTDGTDVADILDLASSNPLTVAIVDGNGDQITSFGGGTQYTEDAAAAANPVGTAPMLVRADTPAGVTSANGDNIAQRGTDYGAAYVQLVTSAGAFIDSVGGGTEYTEDAAAAANPVGKATILVRADTPSTIASADGDNVAQRGTDYGAAYVQVVDSSGNFVNTFGGGTQYTEGDTDASITGTALLAEASGDTLATLKIGAGTEASALRVTIATDSTGVLSVDDNGSTISIDDGGGAITVDGTVAVTDGGGSITVDNGGTFAVQVDGAALTALQLIDDPVATLGTTTYTETTTKGMIIGAVRRDADTTLVDTTNEISPLQVDANGRLKVEVFDGGDSHTIDDGGSSITVDNGGTFAVQVSSIAAGTNNIGDVDIASIAAGDNNIGNVDIVSVPAPLSTTGGGTEAAALRVTIATDSTGVVSVDDNGSTLSIDDGGGTITVDGTVAVSGTVTVAAHAVTNAGTFVVQENGAALTALQLIDDPVVTLGTTTYTEATTKGMVLAAVRRDADTSAVNTDNEHAPLIVDANGYLKVEIFDGGGSHTVDGTVTANLAAGTNNIGDVDILSIAAGDNNIGNVDIVSVPAPLSTTGGGTEATALRVTIANDSTGVVSIDDNGGSLTVDYATTGSGTATGALRVELANNGTGTLASVTSLSILGGSNIAHDSADSGVNPHKIGARAETSPKGITLVSDGDRTDLYADADGMLMVKLNTSGADLVSERVSNTDGASTAFTNFSAVASTRNYVTAYSMFRTDAGTTPIYVDIRDGTAGAILWSVVLPPNGGANLASAVPLFKSSANTALAFDVSAATSTVYISMSGYQSKVG